MTIREEIVKAVVDGVQEHRPMGKPVEEIADLILNIVASKLQYRDNTDTKEHLPEYDDHISVGYNMAIDDFKDLLMEGMEGNK